MLICRDRREKKITFAVWSRSIFYCLTLLIAAANLPISQLSEDKVQNKQAFDTFHSCQCDPCQPLFHIQTSLLPFYCIHPFSIAASSWNQWCRGLLQPLAIGRWRAENPDALDKLLVPHSATHNSQRMDKHVSGVWKLENHPPTHTGRTSKLHRSKAQNWTCHLFAARSQP